MTVAQARRIFKAAVFLQIFRQDFLHGRLDPPRQREPDAPGCRLALDFRGVRIVQVDSHTVQQALQLLKSQGKVHTLRMGDGFRLFGNARPDKTSQGIGVLVLQVPGARYHGRRRFGNVVIVFREMFLHEIHKSRAAGTRQKVDFLGHLLQELFRLMERRDISADGNFGHFEEAQFPQSSHQLAKGDFHAELADKGRGQHGNDLFLLFQRGQERHEHAPFVNGPEGTGRPAVAAVDTLIVIDDRTFVRAR